MIEETRTNHSDDSLSENAPLLLNDSRYFRPIHTRVISPIIAEDDDSITIRQPFIYNHSISDSNIQTAAMINRYRYYGRLEPQSNSSLMMPNHVVPSCFYTVLPIVVELGKQSSIITIFSIWNTMMGTSILTMPFALEQAGFGCGLFLLLFMAGIMLYTAFLILKSSELLAVDAVDKTSVDFSTVCQYYLGRWGEILSVIFSLASLIGALIAYWILMSNFLYNSVSFIYDKATGLNSSSLNGSHYDVDCHVADAPAPVHQSSFYDFWKRDCTVPLILVCFVMPLINFKSPTFFTKFNALGTISIAFIIIFVSVKSGQWGFHANFTSQDKYKGIPEFQKSFPALTGTLSLAYFVHNCVISIMRLQKNPQNNGRDLTIAFACVASTYIFVAVFFYLCFPLPKYCIADNLLDNFRQSDVMAFVGRIFLFFQMLTVFPLLAYIIRVQLFHTLLGSVYPGWKFVLALNCCIVTIGVLMAIYLPKINIVIRFAGAFCSVVYVFSLPGLVDILSRTRRRQTVGVLRFIINISIFIFGLLNFAGQFVMEFTH